MTFDLHMHPTHTCTYNTNTTPLHHTTHKHTHTQNHTHSSKDPLIDRKSKPKFQQSRRDLPSVETFLKIQTKVQILISLLHQIEIKSR